MEFSRLYENLSKWFPSPSECAGAYDIPVIAPTSEPDVTEWIPFNDLSKPFKATQGIHMFVDDYRMKRLWAQPDRYLAILELAGCVASPDFSIYQDTPEALNIYCHYMKHWLAAYWQSYGIKVIPTMGWGTKKSFSWCFDGEPQNATVIVSSIGWGKEKDISGFMRGYDAMLEKLNPSKILFYGQVFDECEGNIEKIAPFYNIVAERRKSKSNV